jgi:hypothetical protein
MKNTKPISAGVVLLAVILTVVALNVIKQRHQVVIVDIPKYTHTTPSPAPTPSASTPPGSTQPKTNLLLSVPFTPQAPTANWDTIHNEDCEEASAIMANAYYNGPHVSKLDPAYVEGLLTKLTDWEMQTFGYNLDINSQETVKMIEANFSLNAEVVNGFTEDDIKKDLVDDKLILIPENGQLLGNPNYKQPGPKYHMLVIRGFTSSSIITNDPGTHNGLNYNYSYDTLYNANGEWSHQTNSVDLSQKNIIVVWK